MLKTTKIVFEDEWVLVVDKKPGVVVNRSETIKEGTLQDDLATYFGLKTNDLGIGDRAGIVHRLDRETSGLIVVAKTQKGFDNLQAQFKERQVSKEYIALVHGRMGDQSGSIEAAIARVGSFGKFGVVGSGRRSNLVSSGSNLRGLDQVNLAGLHDIGRDARTDYEVKESYKMETDCFNVLIHQYKNLSKARQRYLEKNATDYTKLSVLPKTGRTHQIRVHLKSIGHPVVSDLIYGPHKLLDFDLSWCPRLFLHAKAIEFVHPKTKKTVKFDSDLPKDLKDAILNLDRLTTNN